MFRSTLSALLLLASTSLFAQTRIDAGLAIGLQSYEAAGESPRVLPSADVLVRRAGPFGAHVAVEYADLEQIGAMVALHLDGVYRRGERYFFLAGAGLTIINTGSASNTGNNDATWNAEVEVGRAFSNMELFIRARHYDFRYFRFRENPASPTGPAVSLGVRFALRR